jgi:hypothetical protein
MIGLVNREAHLGSRIQPASLPTLAFSEADHSPARRPELLNVGWHGSACVTMHESTTEIKKYDD